MHAQASVADPGPGFPESWTISYGPPSTLRGLARELTHARCHMDPRSEWILKRLELHDGLNAKEVTLERITPRMLGYEKACIRDAVIAKFAENGYRSVDPETAYRLRALFGDQPIGTQMRIIAARSLATVDYILINRCGQLWIEAIDQTRRQFLAPDDDLIVAKR